MHANDTNSRCPYDYMTSYQGIKVRYLIHDNGNSSHTIQFAGVVREHPRSWHMESWNACCGQYEQAAERNQHHEF